ncbi:MAG TPA: hypothetical protein VM536_17845 [Chloroflexia bacterium]|nr:hypothetical protein [Chloroflexia bacterium]
MNFARILTLLVALGLLILVVGSPASPTAARSRTPTPTATPTGPSGPPAPVLLAPANGAQVSVPFTISWSAVTDPHGIVAYNWQVSPSSSFAPVVALNSTGGSTQDTVDGLATGTYFWRVQAVNGTVVQGAWSSVCSFTVIGANPGAPGSPTLSAPHGGTAFHPMEVISFDWSAVPGAATYNFDAATDPNFPVATRVHFDNIPNTTYALQLGDSMPQGTWYVRVTAVNANRIAGAPSNVVTFALSFNAPLPPPPTALSPANGATVTLPVTLTWTDVPNPQPSGYVLEIAADPGFANIQYVNNQITGAHWSVTSLPAGTKYWHVLSTQGDSAPGVPANTAWSATRSFVVPSTPPGLGSLAVTLDPAANGQLQTVSVQLTGPAPPGGAVVSLASSDPIAAPVPASVTIAAGFAFDQFRFQVGAVDAARPVTLTATLNATSASVSFVVQPASLQSLSAPSQFTGGFDLPIIVMLSGQAPAAGTVVSLSSSNPALVNVPASVTVAPGDYSVSFNAVSNAVTAPTGLTISASLNGTTLQAPVTLTPQQQPASLTLDPTVASAPGGASGTVRLATAAPVDTLLYLSSSNPAVASVNSAVMVPQGALAGGFIVNVPVLTTTTTVTISVAGAGVTRTAVLTVQPPGGAPAPTTTAVPPPQPTATPANSPTRTATSVPPPPQATLTATRTPTASPTRLPDTVSITRAEYSTGNRELRVEATSTSASAVLRVHETATNQLIGTLNNDGGGRYSGRFAVASNPQNVTVRSSLGGAASRNVIAN